MSIEIKTVVDHERGCGWRKEGGLYMMSSGISVPCGRLPVPLMICPCCGSGIKVARGWTWFNPKPFVEKVECRFPIKDCAGCIMTNPPDKAGLIWVGEKFYRSPAEWTAEALRLGVSRRINMVPKGFKVGETYVFTAHRKCIAEANPEIPSEPKYIPGIFHVFRPDRLEYITTGKETEEELAAIVERGITPVKVTRAIEQLEMAT